MRTLRGFIPGLIIATCLFAQHRGGAGAGTAVRSGTVVAAPAQRATGTIVTPPSGPPALPSATSNLNFGTNLGAFRQGGVGRPGFRGTGHTTPVFVGYPIYVGGGYGGYGYNSYGGYYDNSYMGQGQQPYSQSPNVVVIYPQQPAPVIISGYGQGDGQYPTTSTMPPGAVYQPPVQSQTSEPPSASEPVHYLIAFKDHTIYSAVAYWVEGDTLHYFTNGNTHNQVSVSLVDYELTTRLNKESGAELRLPVVK